MWLVWLACAEEDAPRTVREPELEEDIELSCIPPELRGIAVASDPQGEWALARSCDGGDRSYLFVKEGSVPLLDEDSLGEVQDRVSQLPGVVLSGVSACCRDDLQGPQCVFLQLSAFPTPPEGLPDLLLPLLQGDTCLGVVVQFTGYEGPRCDDSDPGCIPYAYCPEDGSNTACCDDFSSYDPDKERILSTEAYPYLENLESGTCLHDGECVPNGSKSFCFAYTEPVAIGLAVCQPALVDAHCGCVESECRWFTQ